MTRYWLVPVTSLSPLTLGEDRIRCDNEDQLSELRASLARIHPKLMLTFKAHLLVADDESEACGSAEESFDLASPGCVVFDDAPLRLSECGAALLGKLPAPALVREWLENMECDSGGATVVFDRWTRLLKRWTEQGWQVILLREETFA